MYIYLFVTNSVFVFFITFNHNCTSNKCSLLSFCYWIMYNMKCIDRQASVFTYLHAYKTRQTKCVLRNVYSTTFVICCYFAILNLQVLFDLISFFLFFFFALVLLLLLFSLKGVARPNFKYNLLKFASCFKSFQTSYWNELKVNKGDKNKMDH